MTNPPVATIWSYIKSTKILRKTAFEWKVVEEARDSRRTFLVDSDHLQPSTPDDAERPGFALVSIPLDREARCLLTGVTPL
jgi:hypothetical protein